MSCYNNSILHNPYSLQLFQCKKEQILFLLRFYICGEVIFFFFLLLVFIYFMSLYFPHFKSLLRLYCWLSNFLSGERKGNIFFKCCYFHVCNFNFAYLLKSIYVICFLRSDCYVGTLHLRLWSLRVCNYFYISKVWWNFSVHVLLGLWKSE